MLIMTERLTPLPVRVDADALGVESDALGVESDRAAARTLDVGLALPTRLAAGGHSPRQLLRIAEAVDGDPNWHHLWVTDSAIALPFYESIVLLSACAARTSRVRLGIGCMSTLGLRHPLLVAQQLANLDALSEGRLTLVACPGWGSGDHVRRELDAFGVTYREKTRRMEANIEFVRRASTEERPSFDTDRVRVRELELEPAFVQRPLPIWLAANPRADAPSVAVARLLGRVARLGDGWITYAVTPEVLSERVRLLGELRAELGATDGERFPVSVFLSARGRPRSVAEPARDRCRQTGPGFIASHPHHTGGAAMTTQNAVAELDERAPQATERTADDQSVIDDLQRLRAAASLTPAEELTIAGPVPQLTLSAAGSIEATRSAGSGADRCR